MWRTERDVEAWTMEFGGAWRWWFQEGGDGMAGSMDHGIGWIQDRTDQIRPCGRAGRMYGPGGMAWTSGWTGRTMDGHQMEDTLHGHRRAMAWRGRDTSQSREMERREQNVLAHGAASLSSSQHEGWQPERECQN